MYSRLLQPKTAVFYASPEGETDDPFYGPIPRGVGGADLDGIPDSPINNKTPEYAEESRGYKNPLAEKGTENKDEDANLVEGIPPGLIVAKVAYREKGKKEEEVPKEEIKYSLGWWRNSNVTPTGISGTLAQIIQWSSRADNQFAGYNILAFPVEGGEVLQFRGYPFSSFHSIGQDISTKMGIRFEMNNKEPYSDFLLSDLIPKTAGVDIHESPTMLPPRDDLRRHIDEDALDEEEKPEMRHLISCLVVAEKEI